jgi:hypothetical protein
MVNTRGPTLGRGNRLCVSGAHHNDDQITRKGSTAMRIPMAPVSPGSGAESPYVERERKQSASCSGAINRMN